MNPLKVSAQFAAYVWYTSARRGRATRAEALRFAEENWAAFRSCAPEGWGRLLLRVARARRRKNAHGAGERLPRAGLQLQG
jgi:hypothetical protein